MHSEGIPFVDRIFYNNLRNCYVNSRENLCCLSIVCENENESDNSEINECFFLASSQLRNLKSRASLVDSPSKNGFGLCDHASTARVECRGMRFNRIVKITSKKCIYGINLNEKKSSRRRWNLRVCEFISLVSNFLTMSSDKLLQYRLIFCWCKVD